MLFSLVVVPKLKNKKYFSLSIIVIILFFIGLHFFNPRNPSLLELLCWGGSQGGIIILVGIGVSYLKERRI